MADWLLATTAVLLIALLLWLLDAARQRSPRRALRGVGFIAMVLLPCVWTLGLLVRADDTMKTVGFCLRCHEMKVYGESLTADDGTLASQHYTNGWVDQRRACYVCHTSPGPAGFIDAKLTGLHDVRVHYVGTVPENIQPAEPYPNDICLSCHGRDAGFLDEPGHQNPPTLLHELEAGAASCLDCHGRGHQGRGER